MYIERLASLQWIRIVQRGGAFPVNSQKLSKISWKYHKKKKILEIFQKFWTYIYIFHLLATLTIFNDVKLF